jgi:O-antigen/teichoic acid export membrane protein
VNARALWIRLNGQKYRYVGITTLVSLLAFTRNLVFMKTLDLAALGQVALMQTVIMLVGFVQVGVVNGAYIQYAAQERQVNRRIVELMTTCVMGLVPVAAIVAISVRASGMMTGILWPETLAIGLAAGLASLAATWMNNALVADGLLGKSNLINLGAVLFSLYVAIQWRDHGLNAALMSVCLQPLLVGIGAMAIDPGLRPRSLGADRETLATLFRLGLMPFLASLAVLGMHQVERWSIATILGSEALGQLYLVLMYSSFFGLIPAALINVFFPPAKRAYEAGDTARLLDSLRCHRRDLGAYFLAALLVTVILMPLAVDRFLPQFNQSAGLVYYALPGIVLFTLRDMAALVLYSSGQMRPLLTAGLWTLGLFCISLAVLWASGHFSLVSVLIARMGATLPGTVLLFAAQRRQIAEMRRR